MGFFFLSKPAVPTVPYPTLEAQVATPADSGRFEQMAAEVAKQDDPPSKFSWWRLGGAFVLLVVLFGAGMYTARNAETKQWSEVLLHSFELLLGAIIGMITGEAVTKQ